MDLTNQHSLVTGASVHVPIRWTFANATARGLTNDYLTGIPYVSSALGNFAVDSDDHSVWMLVSTTPTWMLVTAPAASVPRPYGFIIPGALTTSSKVVDILLPYAITVSKVVIGVGTAPATSALLADVTYHATNPTSKTTIFTAGPGTNRPSIATSAFLSTLGVPEIVSLAQNGHIGINLAGTFTAATDLTVWILPV